MAIRIPNSKLSPALFRRGSDLDVMVAVSDDAVQNRKFGADATLNVTWQLLRKACPDYKACMVTVGADGCLQPSLLCKSGEGDGHPYRFDCANCRVSQFSRSGFFTGEIVPISALLSQQSA